MHIKKIIHSIQVWHHKFPLLSDLPFCNKHWFGGYDRHISFWHRLQSLIHKPRLFVFFIISHFTICFFFLFLLHHPQVASKAILYLYFVKLKDVLLSYVLFPPSLCRIDIYVLFDVTLYTNFYTMLLPSRKQFVVPL